MAAKRIRVSTKRLMIDKANSRTVVIVAVAAFVTAFSLVASRALLAQRSYQSRVIDVQEKARDQLRANIEAVDDLRNSYDEFTGRTTNIIGGRSGGSGDRDGDNSKIILDALPSEYDFPALIASVEKILVDRNYSIESIGGVDNEATVNPSASGGVTPTQTATPAPAATTTPTTVVGQAVEMPFEVTANGSYATLMQLLQVFDQSIRPIRIQQLTFSAQSGTGVQMEVRANSYYQPDKSLNITTKVVQ